MMNLTHWPKGLSKQLELPHTSLYHNLETSAARYPDRTAIHYYGTTITYAQLKRDVDAMAGYLQQRCGVGAGDRVVLYLQNSPQFIIALYAVFRANAVAVPVNPMNLREELRHIVADSGATVIVFEQDLRQNVTPLFGAELAHGIVATYSDYQTEPTDLPVPELVSATRVDVPGAAAWRDALAANLPPPVHTAMRDDLCLIPYTSGTTGAPKGCIHTHGSVMHTAIAGVEWCRLSKDRVTLAALPMFHVTGMQNGVNTPIYLGVPIIIMTRWDKRAAAMLIARHRVTTWTAIPTMLIDFLNQPELASYDLGSLETLTGGGAAMPKAIALKIESLWGIPYVEGYGLSETMAPSHLNPTDRPKPQCLGIPIQGTTAIVVDPDTMTPLPQGQTGEILINGPQVFKGYWGRPDATEAAFTFVDGMRFFRSGDLATIDEDGYFFMVDRLKRMINASGYKVWPAEVESMMYAHPAILEACVVASHDTHRGETVKAYVVLKPDAVLDAPQLTAWARENMAAYKVPQVIEFIDRLPKSATGKVQWRELQEKELAAKPA